MVETQAGQRPQSTITVELGPRSYDILIGRGIIDRSGFDLAERFPGTRIAIVTDDTVARLHLDALTASLAAAGVEHMTVTVPAGEASKSFDGLAAVVDGLLATRIERGDLVVAFGGGVVGDLAGFAAAIVRRGVRLVQMPTTLLAQVDSSIGGKTGINTPRGKNLVGAFYQPELVLADAGVLDSLSPRVFNSGYAEVVKIALIGDPEFFAWLTANWRAVAAGWPEREYAIATACRAKAETVAADEREQGRRALLNLGHTFGHALEAATGYSDRLHHGEAVSIGMVLAHRFSARLGLAPEDDVGRLVAHLSDVGLPTAVGDIPGDKPDVDTLMSLIAQDKKVSRGRLTFILTRGIGHAFIANDVAETDVRAFLEEALSQ